VSGYGVFVHKGRTRIGYRAGDVVFDLTAAEREELVDGLGTFQGAALNDFLALGAGQWTVVAQQVTQLPERLAVPLEEVEPLLPFQVADYVDFYSSEHHATNVSAILRPGQPGLQPNWRHLPVGYHGRAGTVLVSGTPVVRPYGQRGPGDVGPSQRLDIEAELGFVVGVPSQLGRPVSTGDLTAHVFGVVLVNDWSARDLQAWEYQPLGPFLSKSFATSVSPWVVPLSELATVAAPDQDPPVVGYLVEEHRSTFDIELTVEWNGTEVSRPPFRTQYWTPAQQLAHLTVNGASVRTGDLFASGTISGPRRDQVGSFLELSRGGTEPVTLADGSTRTYLADGDTVTIRGRAAGADGGVVDLGEVGGTVVSARGVGECAGTGSTSG
jgi:fumarylacetoacetase